MIRPVLVAVLLCAVLAACSSSPSGNGVPSPLGIDRNPLLTQVTSCNQLETKIEDTLVLEMRSEIEQIRDNDFYIGYGGLPVGAATPTGPVAAPNGASAGPTSATRRSTPSRPPTRR